MLQIGDGVTKVKKDNFKSPVSSISNKSIRYNPCIRNQLGVKRRLDRVPFERQQNNFFAASAWVKVFNINFSNRTTEFAIIVKTTII